MIDKDKIYSDIDQIIKEIGTAESSVISILNSIQRKYNYLPEIALRRVCETTDITPVSITGVSTFYNQYYHSPVGKHLIHICYGTACLVKGAELIYDAFFLSFVNWLDHIKYDIFNLNYVSLLTIDNLLSIKRIF